VAAAAALGGLGSRDAPAFYAQLALPAFAPPAGVFGPVWSVLYAMMGVAAWLVAREPGNHKRALTLFTAQLAVNVLWSWLFFAWKTGAGAVADILLLDALVLATIAAFWRVRRLAAILLLPYLAWILFATALCIACWRMNPGLL
jgi:tryptophan-rich sensory protein